MRQKSESRLEGTPHNNELQRTRPGFARSLAAELSVLRTHLERLREGNIRSGLRYGLGKPTRKPS
jgi:hypothetical protein